ncbi:hypothetical protein QTH09_00170 [Clostridium perfringens]|nr:hypothetical protein [Clostridium perfringens]
MEKEKAIELLRKDLEGYKLRLKAEKIEENRRHFSEKIEALELAVEELTFRKVNNQENLISLNISIDKEKLAREIIKLINDSQDNKGIGLINI